MATAPSTDELVLYILLPIILFAVTVFGTYYCYRRRKLCFSTKDEALLGNTAKKRFTVDMGKRRRRTSSITSSTGGSLDYCPQDYYQQAATIENNNHCAKGNTVKSSSSASTIITTTAAIPRPDYRRSIVVGQAVGRDQGLSVGQYLPQRRATSPAQSLPDYYGQFSSPTDEKNYLRHHSYDSVVSGRRVSDHVVYNTIRESEISHELRPDREVGDPHKGAVSPRKLRHQARVKGKDNEPSFSRPTNAARVSLIVSTVESLDFESSSDSEREAGNGAKHGTIYSPSPPQPRQRLNSKGELQPTQQDPRRLPSSGKSSPSILTTVNECEDMPFTPKSPRIRSRSSPVESQPLDMYALEAALNNHRKSIGDVFGNPFAATDDETDGTMRSEKDSASRTMLDGRRTGADGRLSPTASKNSSSSSLAVEMDPYFPPTARQGRRKSSMQMPIDLRQINPKLYEDMIRLPSMDSEEPDDDTPMIHFQLDYRRDMDILDIKLIQACNLKTQDFSGTCDPYCSVALLPGFAPRQTKVHRKNTDPEFEEKFNFSVKEDDLKNKTLEIRAFDFDQFSRDECTSVMQMKMDVIDFGLSDHYDLWKKFRTEDLDTSESVEVCGDLLLALSYLPSAEKLTVAIQKARNLKFLEGKKGAPDPYIKVCIYRGSQRLKKKKTDTKHNTYNPVFNQALTFSVSPELLQSPIVRISCHAVHDQKLAYNENLGYLEIGPNSKGEEELGHWKDVTGKHSNKPVARWHRLRPITELNNGDDDAHSPDTEEGMRRSSSSILYPPGARKKSIVRGGRKSLT